MFFRKRDIEAIIDAEVMNMKLQQEKDKDRVKCGDCGAYIDKINLVEIFYASCDVQHVYYCGKCKKPYHKFFSSFGGSSYSFTNGGSSYSFTKDTFFREIECDKDGVPVGYVSKEDFDNMRTTMARPNKK